MNVLLYEIHYCYVICDIVYGRDIPAIIVHDLMWVYMKRASMNLDSAYTNIRRH